jgi:UDP-N-acetylglucosamine diphosphorylase/glucosamine-1-phosphate N-acetyltransferase
VVEREYSGHSVNHDAEGDVIFLNGRLLALGDSLEGLILMLEKAVAVQHHGELVGARVTGAAAGDFARDLLAAVDAGEPAPFPPDHTVAAGPEGLKLVGHLWDLVAWNADVLQDDFHWIQHPQYQQSPKQAPGAQILHRDHILCREGVKVEAGAILDPARGPIFLGEGAHVQHNAVVLGPAYIGPRSIIRVGARIEGPVSIGPMCKVGGEVSSCLFQGYANKQHDGFLGHAYVGAWINLGAGTNNSDLKNNYGTVKVWTPEGVVDTDQRFVGLFMGDHSKTAIGTVFNTGTVVGFSCNVFGAGFPPKHVPSFSWGGADGIVPYDVEKAAAVARGVMRRREVDMEPADEVLFHSIHAEASSLGGGGEMVST